MGYLSEKWKYLELNQNIQILSYTTTISFSQKNQKNWFWGLLPFLKKWQIYLKWDFNSFQAQLFISSRTKYFAIREKRPFFRDLRKRDFSYVNTP